MKVLAWTWIAVAFAYSTVAALDPFIPAPIISVTWLPGEYTCEIGRIQHSLKLNGDQTFTGACITNGVKTDEYGGTWRTIEHLSGEVVLEYIYTKSKKIGKGVVDNDYIVRLDQSALALKSVRGGSVRVWAKKLTPTQR